jgi:hypothetical protein
MLHQHRGDTSGGRQAADRCCQEIQDGGPSYGGNLEDTHRSHKKFRRVNAPELLAKVYEGVKYNQGIEVTHDGIGP